MVGPLTMGVGLSLTILPVFGTLLLPLGCLIQSLYERRCLILLKSDIPCQICLISLGDLSFSEGKWKRSGSVDTGKRGGRGNFSRDVIYERKRSYFLNFLVLFIHYYKSL